MINEYKIKRSEYDNINLLLQAQNANYYFRMD